MVSPVLCDRAKTTVHHLILRRWNHQNASPTGDAANLQMMPLAGDDEFSNDSMRPASPLVGVTRAMRRKFLLGMRCRIVDLALRSLQAGSHKAQGIPKAAHLPTGIWRRLNTRNKGSTSIVRAAKGLSVVDRSEHHVAA
jgi:hypothetical protein